MVNDENIRVRIRILIQIRIQRRGSGFTPKCRGAGTLVKNIQNLLLFTHAQDEREEKIFAVKKVYDDANEYFEEMKKETEEKRLEREAAWADRELSEREKAERAEQRSTKNL